ncbi:ATP12 family chaperone protein [Sabulicella rubraurantiaca]|uniref:ATP12 family chaperone protein n=1 Tax=Sabulicella rubraurantiaca TaxID=2811429 RepID=UPI001A9784D7|nr:ATP12 family protein [Sabulicella rubraurantiaca]
MKRFWDEAGVVAENGRFAIRLDGRPVRLPGGGTLSVEQAPLAEALAAEWQAAGGGKGGEMRWDDVPLTRLVGTAAERIAPDPAPTVAAIARYGETDLLCYRADDPALAARQAKAWQPWLDWSRDTLGAELAVTEGIMPMRQPSAALRALEAAVAAHPPVPLAALGVLVPALGSLVLGLAVTRGGLTPEEAHRLAVLDELFQEERWGLDWEAEERRTRVGADIALAARLAALAR